MRICVLIPAYNEERTIAATVLSVMRAGISPNDIVVIDDCSEDSTPEIVSGIGVRSWRNQVNLGKAVSIGCALSQMSICDSYDLVALLDADTEVDPSYFARMAATAAGHPDVVLFVGQVKSGKHNWVTSSRAFDYTYMHDIYKTAQSKFSLITVGPGCASMYRSGALRRIEFTKETLAEDMDWTIQVYRKRLGKSLYVPDAIVYTQDPNTLKDYVNQTRRWYVGFMQVVRKHRIPAGFQGIDFEIGFLFLEGLFYSTIFAFLPLVLLFFLLLPLRSDTWVIRLFLADLAVFSGLAAYGAIRNRRVDIVRNFPLFYVIRYLNAYVFLESFLRVYIKGEVVVRWYKVPRYPITQKSGASGSGSSQPY